MSGRLYKRNNFSVGSFDPMKGDRLRSAWLAMEAALIEANGRWIFRNELSKLTTG